MASMAIYMVRLMVLLLVWSLVVAVVVLHEMSEDMVTPVQGIMTGSSAICDNHHRLSEEEFGRTVDDIIQNTNQVTTLLDKLLREAQGDKELIIES